MKSKLFAVVCFFTVSIITVGFPARGEDQKNIEVVKTGDLFTLKTTDARLSDILSELKKQSDITVSIDPQLLSEKHTLDLVDVTYEDIVKTLAGNHALIYEKTAEGEYRLVSARLTGRRDYIAPVLVDLPRKEQRNIAEKAKQTKGIVSQVATVYGEAGELDYDQAKALNEERKAKMAELVQQLIALGPGGARAMKEMYGEKPGTREQLAMIEALAYIDDPEATQVLGQLYANETSYSLLREIVGSMGRRSGEDVNAILEGILDSQEDVRLRAAATQAMAGRAESLNALTSLVNSPSESPDVKSEAVRSMGLVANSAAMNTLVEVSASSDYDLALRKSAIQELGRTFGATSVPALTSLLESPEEAILQSVVRSLAKVEGQETTEILQSVAAKDVSANVRSHAESILINRTAAPVSAN